MSQGGRLRIMRGKDWADPVRPARREVREAVPETAGDRPPVLFVPGYGYGAWAFEEHWLEHAAQRGFPAYAMSLRGHGGSEAVPDATLRAYAHDVVQVAASLPRQAVLVGHGAGALVVSRALARYPARAGVLVAPVLGGAGVLAANLRHNPFGTLPALFGARVRWRARQLFSAGLPAETARGYLARLGGAAGGRSGSCCGPARASRRSVIPGCWCWAAPTTGWCRRRRSTGRRSATVAHLCSFPGWDTR